MQPQPLENRWLQSCVWAVPLALLTMALLVIQPWGNFPLNDDWVYAKNALMTSLSGKLTVVTSQYAWAIPQMWLGSSIAGHSTELHTSLRWVGIVSLVFSWILMLLLAPIQRAPVSTRILLSACLLFLTPFTLVGLSFMTDAPFLILWMITLWSWGLWASGPNLTTLLVATVSSALAIAQRQHALLIPAAMGFLGLWDLRHTPRQWKRVAALLAPALTVPIFIGIDFWWRRNSPLSRPPSELTISPVYFLNTTFLILAHLGMLGLPLLAMPLSAAAKNILKSRTTRALLALFFTYCVGHQLNSGRLFPFTINQMSSAGFFGPNEILFGDRPPIYPTTIAIFLSLVSILGAFRIAVGLIAWLRAHDKTSFEKLLLTSGILYFAVLAFRATFFDRYALPLIPVALGSLIQATRFGVRRPIATTVGVLATIGLVALSTTLIDDYFRWNEARWNATEAAESLGYTSKDIGGGYEYYGWKGTLSAAPSSFSVVVAFSRLPGFELIREFPYRSAWNPSGASIKLLKRVD